MSFLLSRFRFVVDRKYPPENDCGTETLLSFFGSSWSWGGVLTLKDSRPPPPTAILVAGSCENLGAKKMGIGPTIHHNAYPCISVVQVSSHPIS